MNDPFPSQFLTEKSISKFLQIFWQKIWKKDKKLFNLICQLYQH